MNRKIHENKYSYVHEYLFTLEFFLKIFLRFSKTFPRKKL